jgi:hypothetical protein
LDDNEIKTNYKNKGKIDVRGLIERHPQINETFYVAFVCVSNKKKLSLKI